MCVCVCVCVCVCECIRVYIHTHSRTHTPGTHMLGIGTITYACMCILFYSTGAVGI